MELAAKRFARRVLFAHFILLFVVILTVACAVRYLYTSARVSAIEQAEHTQELLARQTALGIQNYYDSVIGVLELLQPSDEETAAATQPSGRRPNGPQQPPPGQPRGGRPGEPQREARRRFFEGGGFAGFATSVWQSIDQRASLLFIVDPDDAMSVMKVVGSSDDSLDPAAIAKQAEAWLTKMHTGPRRAAIGPFMQIGPNRAGANLVCVPMRGRSAPLMIAVVPIAKIEQTLLRDVNSRENVGAMLIDDSGVIVSNSRAELVGLNIRTDLKDPRTRALAAAYMDEGKSGTQIFE